MAVTGYRAAAGVTGPCHFRTRPPLAPPTPTARHRFRLEPDVAGGIDVEDAVGVDLDEEQGLAAGVAELPGAALPVVLQRRGAGGGVQEPLDAREQLLAVLAREDRRPLHPQQSRPRHGRQCRLA